MKQLLKNFLGRNLSAKALNFVNILRNILGKKKIRILVDTTDGCNLRCSFCNRNNSKITMMSTSDFDTILKKVSPFTDFLQLCCAWEYSISKNATEIVKTLGNYNILNTTLYTNGNILPDDLAREIVKSRINFFVVSIGESKKQTYEKIRIGGSFEKVLSNIKKIDQFKKELNSKSPKICVNLTLIKSNIGELIEFVDLAKDIGVEEIRGRHLILNKGIENRQEIISDIDTANRIIKLAEKKCVEYGMSFDIPRYFKKISKKVCDANQNQLYISSDGEVSICPRIHYYSKIGNIINEDLNSILEGVRMDDIKKQFKKSEYKNPVCGICIENKEAEIPIDQGF